MTGEGQYHFSTGQSFTGTGTHTTRTEEKSERTTMDGRTIQRKSRPLESGEDV